MRELRLKSLQLTNFQGVKESTVVTNNGQDIALYGDNKLGKTTHLNAISWLLFGKDIYDNAEGNHFKVKPQDVLGNDIHHLTSEVEAEFILDGKTITLKKAFEEKWTKRRGKTEKEFDGHVNAYEINGVPKKKKEYDAYCASLITEDLFRLLTLPTFFSEQLSWQKRREMLLGVCGGISNGDVLDKMATLHNKDLIGYLSIVINTDSISGDPVDDEKKVIAAERTKLNKKMTEIPARIDEASRSMPELVKTDATVVIKKIEDLQTQIDTKRNEISSLGSGVAVAKLETELEMIVGELLKLQNDHQRNYHDDLSEKRKALGEVKQQASDCEFTLNKLETKLSDSRDSLQQKHNAICNAGERYLTERDRVFDISPERECPTCKQSLPTDQIEQAIDLGKRQFNEQRSEALANIEIEGNALKAEIKGLEACIAETGLEVAEKRTQKDAAVAAGKKLDSELAKLTQSIPSLESLPEYTKIIARKEKTEQKLEQLKSGNSKLAEPIEQEIATLKEQLSEQQQIIAAKQQRINVENRIAELEDELKECSVAYENLEGNLFALEEFTRQKVALLEDTIADKFEMVRFKLFIEQNNGGLKDCCEMMVDGVPYDSLNSAARIQGGLDIIRTLSRHHQFAPFVMVDNRESVTRLPDMGCQVFSTFVDADDTVLRVAA